MRRRTLLALALLLACTAAGSQATDQPVRSLAARPLEPTAGNPNANPRVPTATATSTTARAPAAATAEGRRLEFPDVDLTADASGGGEVERAAAGRSILPAALPLDDLRALTPGRSLKLSVAGPRGGDKDAPWSADRLLANPTSMDDGYVSLAVSPVTGWLYAVFEAKDLGGTDRDIHIARSQNDGLTWTVWDLPSFTQDEAMPEIAIDGAGFLHVVWLRLDGYIVRVRSSAGDNPAAWSSVRGLFTDSTNATPSVAVSGAGDFATLFIAASYQEINWDLYQWEWTLIWMYSTNAGTTVTYDYLEPDGYPDLWPDCALDDGLVHLVNAEVDLDTGLPRILISSDAVSGGFNDITDLSAWTANGCGFPQVACQGDDVFVVYQHDFDDGLGNLDGDIVYAFSWDAGATFYGPYEIVADEYESVGPTVYARDGVVGALWLDAPPGGDEFDVAARQAGGRGHPDHWGDIETVSDQNHAEPQFHFLSGAAGAGRLHAAWIDRRNYPTQGLNVYHADRAVRPNLAAFTPAGWDGPLVGGLVPGERTVGWFAADRPAYVSFAVVNAGLADATSDVLVRLRVDGAVAAAWQIAGGLPAATYAAVEDHALTLGAGPHEISVVLDPLNAVPEDDETDNTVLRTWTWLEGDPILRVEPDRIRHDVAEPMAAAARALAESPPVRLRHHLPVLDARLAEPVKAAPDGTVCIIVTPARQVDAAALGAALDGAGKNLRRGTVGAALRSNLARSRAELAPLLAELTEAGLAGEPVDLWLAGSLALRATPEAARRLAEHPAVGRIWLDDRPSEAFGGGAGGADEAAVRQALAWHLGRIGADDAWAAGYDGDGVLVGHVDTGVAYAHPDLADHMWDGGAAWPHHGWDAVDDDDDPVEGDPTINHGTHTAGLVVGDGALGTRTGAAPGATLMALRAVPGSYADLIEAMQFGLDHGPVDLFTMSAGWSDPLDDLKEANRANAEFLLAMGIPWFCAAGNGDNYGGHYAVPQDISSPGDCPDPWYGAGGHSAVITVGATTSADATWAYSSLGPTVWNIPAAGYGDYPYPPGLVKPDLAAPGDGITSTIGTGGYAAYSGTSMATPLVAGAAAICLQASPGASPAQLAEALESTARDLGAPGRDNQSGAGLLDLPAALAALPRVGVETFVVHNDGPLPLLLQGAAWSAGWLAVSPRTATVAPGDSLAMRAVFDATGLAAGLYYDAIALFSNDPAGPHTVFATLAIGEVTGVDDGPPAAAGARLAGWPNPFNPRTTVRFDLPRDGRVELAVYDLQGRRVRTLLAGNAAAGPHEVLWQGDDDAGRALPSGVYLARLRGPEGTSAERKLTLVR